MDLAEYRAQAKAKKPHKYRAKRTIVDGIVFDSKREAARYQALKLLERAGKIEELELQPEFDLLVQGGAKVGKYKADFRYFDVMAGRTVIEDAKGMQTPVYRLKKRIVEAVHKIKIVEV